MPRCRAGKSPQWPRCRSKPARIHIAILGEGGIKLIRHWCTGVGYYTWRRFEVIIGELSRLAFSGGLCLGIV